MVAFIGQTQAPESTRRMVEIFQQAGLPGEAEDHVWMANRLHRIAENVDEGPRVAYITDLLISGLLLERGFDPAHSTHLQGRDFPEHCLRAVPGLLKHGFPRSSWQLVERGVLVFEGVVWGKTERWVIQGQLLKPLLDTWHEIGEQLVFKNLAGGLSPLLNENLQIKISGVNRETGREWLAGLRQNLPGGRGHLFVGV
jgi:hypothetical protein